MIRTIIVDDEEKAIQSLAWELNRFQEKITIVASFTSPKEALAYCKENTQDIDCIFLDIQMPAMDGFQFLKQLQPNPYQIVFTTAYDEYAIKAIKHDALDYLLKPIDTDDLAICISRIQKNIEKENSLDKLEEVLKKFQLNSKDKKITINTDGKLIFLKESDIIFAASDGNYSTLHLADNQKIVLTKKLKEVNDLLPDDDFFRIHNSYIINLNKVKEFFKTDGYVVMNGNQKIPVARQRKTDFLDKL